MKLRQFLKEMSMPNVVNLDQATNAITMAYNAAMKGPVNQDVAGALNSAAQWLQQQPNLGSDSNLQNLAKKAKIAQQKLAAARAPLSPNQPQNTTQRTDAYGQNINR